MELLRLQEAEAFVAAITDTSTRELATFAFTVLVGKRIGWAGAPLGVGPPIAPVDALYYIECMTQVFADRDRMVRMMNGEIMDEFGSI